MEFLCFELNSMGKPMSLEGDEENIYKVELVNLENEKIRKHSLLYAIGTHPVYQRLAKAMAEQTWHKNSSIYFVHRITNADQCKEEDTKKDEKEQLIEEDKQHTKLNLNIFENEQEYFEIDQIQKLPENGSKQDNINEDILKTMTVFSETDDETEEQDQLKKNILKDLKKEEIRKSRKNVERTPSLHRFKSEAELYDHLDFIPTPEVLPEKSDDTLISKICNNIAKHIENEQLLKFELPDDAGRYNFISNKNESGHNQLKNIHHVDHIYQCCISMQNISMYADEITQENKVNERINKYLSNFESESAKRETILPTRFQKEITSSVKILRRIFENNKNEGKYQMENETTTKYAHKVNVIDKDKVTKENNSEKNSSCDEKIRPLDTKLLEESNEAIGALSMSIQTHPKLAEDESEKIEEQTDAHKVNVINKDEVTEEDNSEKNSSCDEKIRPVDTKLLEQAHPKLAEDEPEKIEEQTEKNQDPTLKPEEQLIEDGPELPNITKSTEIESENNQFEEEKINTREPKILNHKEDIIEDDNYLIILQEVSEELDERKPNYTEIIKQDQCQERPLEIHTNVIEIEPYTNRSLGTWNNDQVTNLSQEQEIPLPINKTESETSITKPGQYHSLRRYSKDQRMKRCVERTPSLKRYKSEAELYDRQDKVTLPKILPKRKDNTLISKIYMHLSTPDDMENNMKSSDVDHKFQNGLLLDKITVQHLMKLRTGNKSTPNESRIILENKRSRNLTEGRYHAIFDIHQLEKKGIVQTMLSRNMFQGKNVY